MIYLLRSSQTNPLLKKIFFLKAALHSLHRFTQRHNATIIGPAIFSLIALHQIIKINVSFPFVTLKLFASFMVQKNIVKQNAFCAFHFASFCEILCAKNTQFLKDAPVSDSFQAISLTIFRKSPTLR